MIEPVTGGVRLYLWIQPNASKSEIIGPFDNSLKIKIKAPPVDGKANAEIIDFLAQQLELPKRNITILRGDSGRRKCVSIAGIDEATLRLKLAL